jgi:N-acetylglucosamine-6-sulfatase
MLEPDDNAPADDISLAASARPNIVVIMTDDQRWDTMTDRVAAKAMPTLAAQVMAKGVTFTSALTVNSWCCPSRTAFLTGQYSHSNGVYNNGGVHGGYPAFHRGAEQRTVAVWLDDAGYRTGGFGKLLNQYDGTPVAGFDQYSWFIKQSVSNEGGAYEKYKMATDSGVETYGSIAATPAHYSSDVITRKSVAFIESTPQSQPLFLYAAYYAPHAPATPAPRDVDILSNVGFEAPPNHCESDVSDKPRWVRSLEACTPGDARFTSAMQTHLRPLRAVDDGLSEVIAALKATGRMDNTMFVWIGDNGYSRSEHRWRGKQAAFEEDLRLPMALRYDAWTAARAGGNVPQLVLNIDLAPTMAEAAGIPIPATVDGRSLRPLLGGSGGSWRGSALAEHVQGDGGSDPVPTYCAIRKERYKYVAYATHEEELYDLRADPYELASRDADAAFAATKAQLRSDLRALCHPVPPGFSW